jgi:hypothetical protein
MKYSIVILLLFFNNLYGQSQIAQLGGGTTVITLFTKDTIWMASDSKMNFSLNGKEWSSTISKIGNYKNIFFEFSGKGLVLLNKKGDTIFNAFKVMYEGLKKYDDFDKGAKHFNETSKKIWDRYFKTADAIEDKKAWIDEGDILFEMNIISFRKDTSIYNFYLYGVNKDSFNFRFRQIPATRGQDFVHCNGYCTLIKPFFSDAFFIGKTYPQGLTELIKKQITANPSKVGEPINIVVLYNKGHKWLTKPVKVYSTDF